MTQARASSRPDPDDELPPLPGEHAAPRLPADAIPDLDEEDPPEVPADDVARLPEQEQEPA